MLALVRVASSVAPYFTAIGDPGAPGGGGGGGGSVVRYVELPTLQQHAGTAAEVVQRPPEPVRISLPTPQLRPTVEQESPFAQQLVTGPVVPAVRIGQGPGSGGGPGAGTGSGGGIGSGQGTGIGSGQGSGTGGEGGSVLPPNPIGVLMPPVENVPPSIRGQTVKVDFWVDSTGRVTRIDIDPEIEDSGYRRLFLSKMREYRFSPARTLDGEPVNGHLVISIVIGSSL